MHTLKNIGVALAFVLALDFLAFALWIISGQQPVDGFYFGAITANIIKAVLAFVS